MKRKVLVLLLALAMLMTACGGPAASGGNTPAAGSTAPAGGGTGATKVMFWGHLNEAWNLAWDEMIADFNASQSEIVVEVAYFPYDDFEAKMQTALLSGAEGADIYETWGGWALDYGKNGALASVPEQFMSEVIADSYEPVIGAFAGADGVYYGVPLEYNIEYGGMLVNKPLFEAQNIAYPETWDEMIQIARDTSVSNGEIVEMRGLEFTTRDTLTATFLSMILCTGGEYLVDGKLVFNTPEAMAAMQTLVDYVKVDGLTNLDSLTNAAGTDIESYHFLGREEAMQVWRGPWVIPNLETSYNKVWGTDFDYIAQPFYGDGSVKAFPSETGWGLTVSAKSPVAEAAWKFAEYVLNPDTLLQHNIKCGMIPPLKTVANDPAFLEAVPYAQPIIDVLEYGRWIGPFNSDVLKDGVQNIFISLVTDDGNYASTEEALIYLQDDLNTKFGF